MKIYTIGGYNEVGKNMTVVETGKDAFIFDAGLFLPPIVELEERERNNSYNEPKLRKLNAIPDDLLLDSFGIRKKVRAIFLGHGHLDHLGAIPYLAQRYGAEIIGTPFTMEILKAILDDGGIKLKNKLRTIQTNSSYNLESKEACSVDFINVTHSIPQTSMLCLHTPEGNVLYANDFKFDNSPIVGKKPNYEKLEEVGKRGIKAMIVDSLYSSREQKTPSEKVARSLLEDVMLTTNNKNVGMVITTFSSHIARLKSIVDFGKQLNRKIIFVGRSLHKYTSAAIKAKICPFEKDIELVTYRNQIGKVLSKADRSRGDCLIVCTGHQGEPGSVLSRLSKNELPFRFRKGDHVIFSSSVIPTPVNIEGKQQIEKRLRRDGVRIFNDVHVSGHASREDLRDFISMVHPENIIPAHGDRAKLEPMAELASEMGYKFGKNVHLMQDGQKIEL